MKSGMIKGVIGAGLLIAGLLSSGTSVAASERRSYSGSIDGAKYQVEVPERWNGGLVLYSHGYFPAGYDPGRIGLANRAETEQWLLDHGYALAASDYLGRSGAVYEQGPRDQLALLDWFDRNVGRPRQTVALGSSMGGALSVMLAERNPRRFSGVASLCAPMDLNGTWNSILDTSFTLKTLLAPDAEIVRVTNPQRSFELLQAAVNNALTTPQGRARLALAGALGNVPGWVTADKPRSADLDEQIRQQAFQVSVIHVSTFGPFGRVDLERRAGGNPSWNVGIDYRRLLAHSGERELARAAYRAAGLDLDADLAALAAAPRVKPDRAAVDWMSRFAIPGGTTPTPVVTVHNVADAADPGHERWYAQQVRRSGDPARLRQLYADRPGHCSFSAAEEIVVLKALFERINTGQWPNLDTRRLNSAAGAFGDGFHKAVDVATFQDVVVQPGFTRFMPGPVLRPSR